MRRFKYEVGIYNQQVREALQDGGRHRHLSDDWADIHWIELTAVDERDVRERIRARYPPENGYVVTEILLLNRSEEHTSELQSLMRLSYAVFCLNKKKNAQTT